jgi:hypothetical protein
VVIGRAEQPSAASFDPVREDELWRACTELTGVPSVAAPA